MSHPPVDQDPEIKKILNSQAKRHCFFQCWLPHRQGRKCKAVSILESEQTEVFEESRSRDTKDLDSNSLSFQSLWKLITELKKRKKTSFIKCETRRLDATSRTPTWRHDVMSQSIQFCCHFRCCHAHLGKGKSGAARLSSFWLIDWFVHLFTWFWSGTDFTRHYWFQMRFTTVSTWYGWTLDFATLFNSRCFWDFSKTWSVLDRWGNLWDFFQQFGVFTRYLTRGLSRFGQT